MKATQLLKKQHDEVATLFEAIEKADSSSEKSRLFEELAANLVAHDAIERQILYPDCERSMGLDDELGEALVEHGVIEFCLYQATEALGRPDFSFKCKVLKEIVEHHVKEEENEFFPKVEKALGKDRLESLGEDMEAAFDDHRAEDFRKPLFENLRRVLAGSIKPMPEEETSRVDRRHA